MPKTDANRIFCSDIHVDFGLDKCAKIVFKKGYEPSGSIKCGGFLE
jgi:hypothetical protein